MSRRLPLLLAVCAILICGAAQAQGLHFYGQERQIDERTSYRVFDRRPPVFRDMLEIEFEMQLYYYARYGYIFRISDRSSAAKVMNLSYNGQGGRKVFQMNEEGRRCVAKIEMSDAECPDYRWIPVKVCFDLEAGRVALTVGNRRVETSLEVFPARMRPDIIFGLSSYVIDVPSFSIRKLSVSDASRIISFPLDELKGSRVHDENGVRFGSASNHEWMLNRSMHFSHNATMSSTEASGVAYVPFRKEVIYFNADRILRYNMQTESVSKAPETSRCPVSLLLGCNYTAGDSLVVYELSDSRPHVNSTSVASLNLNNFVWRPLGDGRVESPRHHHCSFFNPHSGEYTIFGGYGNFRYNNSFSSLDPVSWKWKPVWEDVATINPRFFSSAGYDSKRDCVWIFGGMGNESGEQEVGRRYYYDLWRLDPATGETILCWSIPWKGQNEVPAHNLVILDDSFYVLLYPEYLTDSTLHLYRFSLIDGSYETLADGIPVVSDKIWSSSSLYFDAELEKFVVTTHNVDSDFSSVLNIYSLSWPPVFRARSASFPEWIPTVLVCLLAAAVLAAVLLLLRKKLRHRKREEMEYLRAKVDPRRRVFRQHNRPNSIYLFGDFTVIDRDGEDISNMFSPQMRTLILILFQNLRSGVSSLRLAALVWPEKEGLLAKNSRGVALNRLRNCFSRMDGFQVSFHDGTYHMEMEDPAYCDYIELLGSISVPGHEAVIRIASRGAFLMNTTDGLFDTFKADVESRIEPVLTSELSLRMAGGEYRNVVEIADAMFNIDPLNEVALHLSVRALLAMRRKEDALVRYSTFMAEYQKENGEPYPVPFEKI